MPKKEKTSFFGKIMGGNVTDDLPQDQEMEEDEEEDDDDDDDDDDEVEDSSDLSEEDDEELTNINDEDAEGEEEELVLERGLPGEDEQLGVEEDDEDDLDDSSDETPGSGAATPDLNKMTKRQRGRPEDEGTLMALDMAPQQRKVQ